MATSLDDFLQTISPEQTYDELYRLRDRALNTFPHAKGSVDDWDEFKNVMERFHTHLVNHIHDLKSPFQVHPTINWGQSVHLFLKIYGRDGDKVAYSQAQSGRRGGLYQVLKDVATEMTDSIADNLIQVRVTQFWAEILQDHRYDVITEYANKWKHILPRELTEDNNLKLRINFPHALAQHPRLLMTLRNALQKKT